MSAVIRGNVSAAPGQDLIYQWGDYFISDGEDWQESALCAQTDPEAFFPEKGGSTRHAKQVCRACPVRPECLTYSLDEDIRFGVWGGLSERERRALKKERQALEDHERKSA